MTLHWVGIEDCKIRVQSKFIVFQQNLNYYEIFGLKKSEGVVVGANINSVDCQQVSESAAAFNEVEVWNSQQKIMTPTSFSAYKHIKRFYNKNNFELTLFLNRI